MPAIDWLQISGLCSAICNLEKSLPFLMPFVSFNICFSLIMITWDYPSSHIRVFFFFFSFSQPNSCWTLERLVDICQKTFESTILPFFPSSSFSSSLFIRHFFLFIFVANLPIPPTSLNYYIKIIGWIETKTNFFFFFQWTKMRVGSLDKIEKSHFIEILTTKRRMPQSNEMRRVEYYDFIIFYQAIKTESISSL